MITCFSFNVYGFEGWNENNVFTKFSYSELSACDCLRISLAWTFRSSSCLLQALCYLVEEGWAEGWLT